MRAQNQMQSHMRSTSRAEKTTSSRKEVASQLDSRRIVNSKLTNNVTGEVENTTLEQEIREASIKRSSVRECTEETRKLVETCTDSIFCLFEELKRSQLTSKSTKTNALEFLALGKNEFKAYSTPNWWPGFALASSLPLEEAVSAFHVAWTTVHLRAMTSARQSFKRYLDEVELDDVRGTDQVLEFLVGFLSSFSGEMDRAGIFKRSLLGAFMYGQMRYIKNLFDEHDGDVFLQRQVNAYVSAHPGMDWLDERNPWALLGGVNLEEAIGDHVTDRSIQRKASLRFLIETMRGHSGMWLDAFISIRLVALSCAGKMTSSGLLGFVDDEPEVELLLNPLNVNPIWRPDTSMMDQKSTSFFSQKCDERAMKKVTNNVLSTRTSAKKVIESIIAKPHYIAVRLKLGDLGCRAILRQDHAVKILPLEVFSLEGTEEGGLTNLSSQALLCHQVESKHMDPLMYGNLHQRAMEVQNENVSRRMDKLNDKQDGAM